MATLYVSEGGRLPYKSDGVVVIPLLRFENS